MIKIDQVYDPRKYLQIVKFCKKQKGYKNQKSPEGTACLMHEQQL